MIKIAHIIPYLSAGGAARAMAGVARTSRQYADYHHTVFSAGGGEPQGVQLAESNGMQFVPTRDHDDLVSRLKEFDLIQIEWWNSPDLDALLLKEFPPSRIISWFHVAGDRSPQYVSPEIVAFSDIALASSPKCFSSPAIQGLSEEIKLDKARMIYDCADFERMKGVQLKPHTGFNVGYIGTVHYIKMHREFLAMSAAANIPDVNFIVCGDGAADEIRREAEALEVAAKFQFKGYVDEIVAEISLMDVYGYPLCDDTYASAELNLQEAMFAGVPPVVFPSGGIEHLVVNDFTGIVVDSPREYTQALEHLYHNEDERKRMGKNAAEYARQIFGEKVATKKFHSLYQEALQMEPRIRIEGKIKSTSIENSPASLLDCVSLPSEVGPGAIRFLRSLGDPQIQALFIASILETDNELQLNIAEDISKLSPLMKTGGIKRYRDYYPTEPYLLYWSGLAHWGDKLSANAVHDIAAGLERGLPHPAALYVVAKCSENEEIAMQAARQLSQLCPDWSRVADVQAPI